MSAPVHDINMLKARLRKSLEAIGKSNGHACPQTQSNIDPVLHELYITAEAMAYFKTRHDKARDEALRVATDVDKAVERATKNMQGESVTGASGDLYTMIVDIAKPAETLDKVALRNYLTTTHKFTVDQIDAMMKACSKLATPAKRIKVVAR